MKKLLQICPLFWLVVTAAAQEALNANVAPPPKTLHVFDWKDSSLQQLPSGSEIFSTNGVSVLKIENANNKPMELSLLTITNMPLIAKAIAISCELKYENVGYGFTMHTNPFRSYTTAQSGSLTFLERIPAEVSGGDESTNISSYDLAGTSNWKPDNFIIGIGYGRGLPTQLELKLSLPTNGTVYLRPIKLLGAAFSFNGWWTPQQAGLIGGIGGSLIGCFGGLIGLLVSKGKARRFVLAAVKCFITLGILLTIAGLVAVVLQQPYAVWYSLLLPGVILILVFSLNVHSIQRRYDELEIRRMTSIDATGS